MSAFKTALLVGVALLVAAPSAVAQTYKEIVNLGIYVSTSKCKVEGLDMSCDLFQKSGKQYLVVYDKRLRPYLVIRREDNVVTWTSNVEA